MTSRTASALCRRFSTRLSTTCSTASVLRSSTARFTRVSDYPGYYLPATAWNDTHERSSWIQLTRDDIIHTLLMSSHC